MAQAPPGGIVATLPLLFLFIIIGLIAGFLWKFYNNNMPIKQRLTTGVIGSVIGGIIGFMTHDLLFLFVTPIIGSVAFLYIVNIQQKNKSS